MNCRTESSLKSQAVGRECYTRVNYFCAFKMRHSQIINKISKLFYLKILFITFGIKEINIWICVMCKFNVTDMKVLKDMWILIMENNSPNLKDE